MEFFSPATWADALELKAEHPGAVPIMGGTDVMVDLNFDRRRPEALLDLTRLPALRQITDDGGAALRLGAGVSYTAMAERLGDGAPALAQAARTVASPQIRNRGSIGGNLATGSPAGDCHPPLLAGQAEVELASVRGVRRVAARDFYLGPKRVDLAGDELVAAVVLPRPAGPQHFAKLGPRNAMVIAVCGFAVALDTARRRVHTGVGAAAPTPVRAAQAEQFAAAELDWDRGAPPDPQVCAEFGRLVAEAARPIDDIRASADYRRHALSVLARRALAWVAGELAKEHTR